MNLPSDDNETAGKTRTPLKMRLFDGLLRVFLTLIAVLVYILAFYLGLLPFRVALLVLERYSAPVWVGAIVFALGMAGGLAAAILLYRVLPVRVWKGIYRDLKSARNTSG